MGFHRYSASKNLRQTHAYLDKKDNGDLYAVYKLNFKKDAPRFEYCFMGEKIDTLTFQSAIIEKHPKFKGIEQFENWCNVYVAENDIK